MKEAFDKYFQKLNKKYKKEFSTLPTVSYSEKIDQSLLVSEPDEDREVQWQPKLQEKEIEWDKIEEEIGFAVRDDLKAYYSTYRFFMLSGKKDDRQLNFYAVGAGEPVRVTVKRNYDDGQYFFKKQQIFIIGQAVVAGDDNYFICYDNKTGKLFCYESDTKDKVFLPNSIKEIFDSMEACL